MNLLVNSLREGKHSLVLANNRHFMTFDSRGVKDLFNLLTHSPELLRGARVADKVVGKGAAALMILGGVGEVYALTISKPALNLFRKYNTAVTYETLADHIINRDGTDICPVEKLCADCQTPEQMLPLIKSFLENMNKK